VIVQEDIHDRLELLTVVLMDRCSNWEKVPDREQAYNPMLERIQVLAGKGLTLMMVLHNFLSKRIAPLQEPARLAWLYTGENDATQLEHACGTDLELVVLETMLSKLSTNMSSIGFIPLWCTACQYTWIRARSQLLKVMPTLDDIDIPAR
jgi:hypothetical protein